MKIQIKNTTTTLFNNPIYIFEQYRLILAKLHKYEIVKAKKYRVPDLDWQSISFENIQGKWDYIPNDPLTILLCHSNTDGILQKESMKALHSTLYWLHKNSTLQLEVLTFNETQLFKTITEKFIKGCITAFHKKEIAVFI